MSDRNIEILDLELHNTVLRLNHIFWMRVSTFDSVSRGGGGGVWTVGIIFYLFSTEVCIHFEMQAFLLCNLPSRCGLLLAYVILFHANVFL